MAYDDELAAYEATRARVIGLVRQLDVAQLATTVQCCPRWSVKDLVGHLAGVAEDRGAGRMPTGGFGEWTDEQVLRHRGESLDELVATWSSLSLERNDAPPSLAALSFDAVVHEHDLFQAVSSPFDRDTLSVRMGASRAADRMASVLLEAGAPGVVLRTEDGERTLEGNGALLGLATGRFELMCLVTGRMSERQARALEWDDDPSAVLEALFADGFFSLQPRDVLEAG